MAGLELRIVARRFQEKTLAGYMAKSLITKWCCWGRCSFKNQGLEAGWSNDHHKKSDEK
jgi:hypothetical protein